MEKGRDVGLAKEAFIFVPPHCATGERVCRLHLWFHGCGGPDRFYNASVHYAGFNEWAEANDLVILYPAMRNWGERMKQRSAVGMPMVRLATIMHCRREAKWPPCDE